MADQDAGREWRKQPLEIGVPFTKIYEGDHEVAICWEEADADRILADHRIAAVAREALEAVVDEFGPDSHMRLCQNDGWLSPGKRPHYPVCTLCRARDALASLTENTGGE